MSAATESQRPPEETAELDVDAIRQRVAETRAIRLDAADEAMAATGSHIVRELVSPDRPAFARMTQHEFTYVRWANATLLKLAARLTALERERDELRAALIAHRADLHNGSSRPCPTCRKSAEALGITARVPDRCASADTDRAALTSSRETTDGK